MLLESTTLDLERTHESFPQPDVGALNELLRGERTAERGYGQAVERFRGTPYGYELLRLREEHRQAANVLRDLVNRHGAEADDTAAEPAPANGAASGLLRPMLLALREGEDAAAARYREAVEGPLLAEDAKHVARNLLQRCREHVDILDRLGTAVA